MHSLLRQIACVVLFVGSLVLAAAPARAQDGALDPAFGTGGIVLTNFPTGNGYPRAVALQSDGKIVAVGGVDRPGRPGYNQFGLARYNTDGSLDLTFGSGGFVTTTFGPYYDRPDAMAIQADDKIIAGGVAEMTGFGYRFGLARYNTDGSLDTTFGGSGKVNTDLAASCCFKSSGVAAIVVQPDGKILAGGGGWDIPTNDSVFALARYNPDGSLDGTFGSGGVVKTSFGRGGSTFVRSLALMSDGRFVAAGVAYSTGNADALFAVARYNSDGSLDTSFGSGGQVTTAIGSGTFDVAFAVILQPDGLVVSGYSTTATTAIGALVRYDANGARDVTFGTNGIVTFTGGSYTLLAALVQQADGKLVAAGTTNNGTVGLVARYHPDGSLDATFGTGGIVTTLTSPSAAYTEWFGLARQTDGNLVAGGAAPLGSGQAFALARYLVAQNTPVGTNVLVQPSSAVALTFTGVTTAGNTIVTPIDPLSLNSQLPGGYALFGTSVAYEITTTATYTGPIVVAFKVPAVSATQFANLRILHGEGGLLVDRTILAPDSPAPDFANLTISARVNSLSPFVVALRDTTPPVVTVPGPITAEATSPAGATVTFTAAASDPDDVAGPVSCVPSSGSTFPLGTTTVMCSSTDTHGNTGTNSFTVTVRDTTAPSIVSVVPSQTQLWPPNNKMVSISVAVGATDLVTASPVCLIASVSSNEPGSGEWQITGPLTLNLMARRNGNGKGRIYTITAQCSDAAGNSSSRSATVLVPHDQGK